jgi:hypothetical protein
VLDFVFFNAQPRARFVAFLQQRRIALKTTRDDESYGVSIPEDTDDDMLEAVESHYGEMLALDQALFEAGECGTAHHAAGVVLKLASGDSVYARVPSDLLARVTEVLTAEELGELVNAIVDAVEQPEGSPLCQRKNELPGEG